MKTFYYTFDKIENLGQYESCEIHTFKAKNESDFLEKILAFLKEKEPDSTHFLINPDYDFYGKWFWTHDKITPLDHKIFSPFRYCDLRMTPPGSHPGRRNEYWYEPKKSVASIVTLDIEDYYTEDMDISDLEYFEDILEYHKDCGYQLFKR